MTCKRSLVRFQLSPPKKYLRRGAFRKAGFACREKQKEYGQFVRTPFYTPLPERYSVLHPSGELSGGNIAFLREEGGTRSVTEGARATLTLYKLYGNAFSLSRLRLQLTPGGSHFVHLCLINFPDKHCFCGHKSEGLHKAIKKSKIRNRLEVFAVTKRIK